MLAEEAVIPTITIKNLSFAFADRCILNAVNLTIPPKRWVGLIGPSGCGKSTFLRLLAGILPLQKGSITLENTLCHTQQVAYMAQTDLLLPWLNLEQNILLPGKLIKLSKQVQGLQRSRVLQLLEEMGLSHALTYYPHQLSGGMRQRAALVRTIIQDKPIVLMDEPFSAVDAINRFKLQNLTAKLLGDKTVIFITHDPLEALRLADVVYLLADQSLKPMAQLASAKPRALTDSTVQVLQAQLYQALAAALP